MSEYRSQVDGRRLQREMAANPSRVRAVPLAEEAEFERAMAQLSDSLSRGGQHHASGLTHAEEWREQLDEAREDALREPHERTSDAHGHGGLSGLLGVPVTLVGDRHSHDEEASSEEDRFEIETDREIDVGLDLAADAGGDLHLEPAPLQHGDRATPAVSARGPDALRRWIDRREEAQEEEEEERWLDEQGEYFETALELVEALHLEVAEPMLSDGGGGSGDERHASDVDAWLDATLDADYSGHALDAAAPEGGDGAPATDAALPSLDGAALVGGGIDAADDGDSEGRHQAPRGDAEGAAELAAAGGSHARDAAHLIDTHHLHGAADVQTDHDLNVDVGDFALRERVYGVAHHFEVVSRGSPVRSVELIKHADGQMTANVTVDGDYAGGLAEFLERMRSRMGRLKLGLLRLIVDERTVAELRPDRKAVL